MLTPINDHLSRAVVGQPEPRVMMGVTILHWSDRTAGTIYAVEKVGKRTLLRVREDDYRVVSGSTLNGSAVYEFQPNIRGREWLFRQDDLGRWEEVHYNRQTKRYLKSRGTFLRLGERDKYYDPHI